MPRQVGSSVGEEAGDIQLSGVHAHLRTSQEERHVPRAAQEYSKATPCQIETGEGRTSSTHASATGGSWRMVEERRSRLLQLPRRSRNFTSLQRFRHEVGKRWLRVLQRRSQKSRLSWKHITGFIKQWLPLPKILHPYPYLRFDAKHLR